MYRDDEGAARSRLAAAAARRERAWDEVRERLDAIAVLTRQLEAKQLSTPAAPEVAAGVPAPAEDRVAGASLAEIHEWAGQLEDDELRLQREADMLGSLLQVMQQRLGGGRMDLALAPGPRPVPTAYRVTEMLAIPGTFWRLWFPCFFMIGPAIAFASTHAPPPLIMTAAAAVAVYTACTVVWAIARGRRNIALLAEGQVVPVTVIEQGTGLTSYKNWPLRQSEGWDVKTITYTGSSRRTRLAYLADDGTRGELVVTGAPWADGIVLYHPRLELALPVHELGSRPRPDHRGQWEGHVPFGTLVGAALNIVAVLLWIGFALTFALLAL